MKNLTLSVFAFAFLFLMSACTKEQTTLNTLHGTWKLTSQLDNDGDPVLPTQGCNVETLITFFLCDDNDQDDCYTSTKTTTTCTAGSTTNTTISASESSYSVYAKDILILGSTTYEIESISKKEFKIHPATAPLATRTYEKQ